MSRQSTEEVARLRMRENAGAIRPVKELTSEQVSAQIEDFLARGKRIIHIPAGTSGIPQPQLSKSQREKACGVKKL